MNDLISRKDVLERLKYEMKYGAIIDQCGLEIAYDIVEVLPPAEQTPTAKVIEYDASVTDADGYKYYMMEHLCGACKNRLFPYDEYCSHCGCRLEWNHE